MRVTTFKRPIVAAQIGDLKKPTEAPLPIAHLDFGDPFSDQKKYLGFELGPGGIFLKASATSGGRGTYTQDYHSSRGIGRIVIVA